MKRKKLLMFLLSLSLVFMDVAPSFAANQKISANVTVSDEETEVSDEKESIAEQQEETSAEAKEEASEEEGISENATIEETTKEIYEEKNESVLKSAAESIWDSVQESDDMPEEILLPIDGRDTTEHVQLDIHFSKEPFYVGQTREVEISNLSEYLDLNVDVGTSKVVATQKGEIWKPLKLKALKAGTTTVKLSALDSVIHITEDEFGSHKSHMISYEGEIEVTVLAPSITLEQESVEVFRGEQVQLNAKMIPEGEIKKWASTNAGIAKVDANGVVTGVAAGNAVVKASGNTLDHVAVTSQIGCKVKVLTPYIEADQENITLAKGTYGQVSGKITPNGSITGWKSSDATIASVDATGKITALKPGTVILTAVGKTEHNVAATNTRKCKVTVTDADIQLSETEVTLQRGETVKLSGSVLPEGNITGWLTTNAGIAKVSAEGIVEAGTVGTATITAKGTTLPNPLTTKSKKGCKITVINPTIEVTGEKTEIYTRQTTKVQGKLSFDGSITAWKSSNASIAKVDNDGVITAVAPGKAVITAVGKTQKGYNYVSSKFTITVKKPFIDIGDTSKTIYKGQSIDLEGSIIPDGVIDTWKSSQPKVASITDEGHLVALGKGTSKITASGTTLSNAVALSVAGVQVQVLNPYVDIELFRYEGSKNITVYTGDTLMFTSKVIPNGKIISYVSSNPDILEVREIDGTWGIRAWKPGKVSISAIGETDDGVLTSENVKLVINVKKPTLKITQPAAVYPGDRIEVNCSMEPQMTLKGLFGVSPADYEYVMKNNTDDNFLYGIKPGKANIYMFGETPNGKVTVESNVVTATILTPFATVIGDATVYRGETGRVYANITPDGDVISWKSSNENVATVSASGLITAKDVGTTKITAICKARGVDITSKEFTLTVKEPYMKIGCPKEVYKLEKNRAVTLSAPPIFKTKTWKSSNASLVYVNEKTSKLVIANKTGSAQIWCEGTTNGGIFVKSSAVTVNVKSPKITPSQDRVYIWEAQSMNIPVSMEPEGIIYKVESNGSVLASVGADQHSVDITAPYHSSSSNIKIYGRTNDGAEEINSFAVSVKEPYISAEDRMTIYRGDSKSLIYRIYPGGRATFRTSNPNIATVNASGEVTAVGTGICQIVIEASTNYGSNHVLKAVVDIHVNEPFIYGMPRNTIQLYVNTSKDQYDLGRNIRVIPDRMNGEIQYKSRNANIASVSSSGVITANKIGTTYIDIYLRGKVVGSVKVAVLDDKMMP